MKKLLLCCLLSTICGLPSAHAWWIDSYSTQIEIQENGSVIIEENIIANFSDDARHGIYRIIPSKTGDKKLRFDLISITDENGTALPFTTENSLDGTTYIIGNPDTLIQESQTYIITYEVKNGISFFEDRNEIYWNATGSDWQTEILNATAKIILPESITVKDEIETICYTGSQDDTEQNCTWKTASPNTIEFSTTKSLNPYETLAVAVKFPLGHVSKPIEELRYLQDFWPAILPIIVFAILFRKWKKHSRNKKTEAISPECELIKELSPAEVSFAAYKKITSKDISATLIDLAIREHLKIGEAKDEILGIFKFKNYTLYRLKKTGKSALRPFEKLLMEKLFEEKDQVKLSDMKNDFHKHISDIQKEIMDSVVKKKTSEGNSITAKTPQLIISGILVIIGFFSISNGGLKTLSLVFGISVITCGIITAIFGCCMPKKTGFRDELHGKIAGLKMYIETANKEKHFEKLLPYTIVFTQTNQWIKQFEGIEKNPPSWYMDQNSEHFSVIEFVNNMEHAISSIEASEN